jgi:hypothetical protein
VTTTSDVFAFAGAALSDVEAVPSSTPDLAHEIRNRTARLRPIER